jgi:hypothetical protein
MRTTVYLEEGIYNCPQIAAASFPCIGTQSRTAGLCLPGSHSLAVDPSQDIRRTHCASLARYFAAPVKQRERRDTADIEAGSELRFGLGIDLE